MANKKYSQKNDLALHAFIINLIVLIGIAYIFFEFR